MTTDTYDRTREYDIDHDAEHWKRVGPELLAALTEALEFVERCNRAGDGEGDMGLEDRLRAVVTKAREA